MSRYNQSPAERRATTLERIRSLVGVDPDREHDLMHEAMARVKIARTRESSLVAELKAFEAYFERDGLTNHFDNERKVILAEIAMSRRKEIEDGQEKVTGLKEYLDDFAHSHPTYKEWLETKREDRRQMSRLQAEVAQARAEVEAARMDVTAAEQKIRTLQTVIAFGRMEGNLG